MAEQKAGRDQHDSRVRAAKRLLNHAEREFENLRPGVVSDNVQSALADVELAFGREVTRIEV